MEHKGIRYTIRVRIERQQWFVAIHPAGAEMAGKVISGPRDCAEKRARYMHSVRATNGVRRCQKR